MRQIAKKNKITLTPFLTLQLFVIIKYYAHVIKVCYFYTMQNLIFLLLPRCVLN